jgi:hypothetical protein
MKSEEKNALIAAMFQGANIKVEQFIAVNEGTVVYNDYKGGKAEPLANAQVVECEEVTQETDVAQLTEEAQKFEQTVKDLVPVFYNDRAEAELFLKRIKGMKPIEVTNEVNELLKAKKISAVSVHHTLHSILKHGGYYERSESNWNKMVVVPRRHK